MNTELIYIGVNGNVINLFQNKWFCLTHADGLTSVSSSIASSTTPGMDGDKINNIQTQPRGIVLDLEIRRGVSVEDAKRYILRTIKPKQRGTLRLTQGDRVTEIEGIVESVNMPRFGDGVTMQVSLYCSEPYWSDAENVLVEISRIIGLHYFTSTEGDMLYFPAEGIPLGEYDLNMTRTYTNDGDADCGMIIRIIALRDVVNPTIYNSDGLYIGVIDTMVEGDEIVINTNRGSKSITKNGANILSKIKSGSTFLQLAVGDNQLTIDSDGGTEGNVYFILEFKRRFV